MAQSITTVLDKNPAGDLSLSDVLYIIQGTGSDRDRNVTLEKIRDFLSINWDDFKIVKTDFKAYVDNGYFIVQNPGGQIKIKGNDIQYISPTMKQKFSLGSSSLEFLTDSGSTEAKYGNDEASVGSVTLDDDGVKVAGTGGSSNLENDELKFTGTGVNGSYYGTGFSITYGNVTLSAVNTSSDTYFGISGQGGGSKLYQDSLVITGNGKTTTVNSEKVDTTKVQASEVSASGKIVASGNGGSSTVTNTSVSVVGGSSSSKIESDLIETSGRVKGWLNSKHIYAASSDRTSVNQNLLNTDIFTAGVIVPIYAIPNTAASYVNYYGADGSIHSFGILQHHAALLVCVGTATVNGSTVPAFCAVVDTNT